MAPPSSSSSSASSQSRAPRWCTCSLLHVLIYAIVALVGVISLNNVYVFRHHHSLVQHVFDADDDARHRADDDDDATTSGGGGGDGGVVCDENGRPVSRLGVLLSVASSPLSTSSPSSSAVLRDMQLALSKSKRRRRPPAMTPSSSTSSSSSSSPPPPSLTSTAVPWPLPAALETMFDGNDCRRFGDFDSSSSSLSRQHLRLRSALDSWSVPLLIHQSANAGNNSSSSIDSSDNDGDDVAHARTATLTQLSSAYDITTGNEHARVFMFRGNKKLIQLSRRALYGFRQFAYMPPLLPSSSSSSASSASSASWLTSLPPSSTSQSSQSTTATSTVFQRSPTPPFPVSSSHICVIVTQAHKPRKRTSERAFAAMARRTWMRRLSHARLIELSSTTPTTTTTTSMTESPDPKLLIFDYEYDTTPADTAAAVAAAADSVGKRRRRLLRKKKKKKKKTKQLKDGGDASSTSSSSMTSLERARQQDAEWVAFWAGLAQMYDSSMPSSSSSSSSSSPTASSVIKWFVVVPSSTYVHAAHLRTVLSQHDSTAEVYGGECTGLRFHADGTEHAQLRAGVVLSRALVRALRPFIQCFLDGTIPDGKTATSWVQPPSPATTTTPPSSRRAKLYEYLYTQIHAHEMTPDAVLAFTLLRWFRPRVQCTRLDGFYLRAPLLYHTLHVRGVRFPDPMFSHLNDYPLSPLPVTFHYDTDTDATAVAADHVGAAVGSAAAASAERQFLTLDQELHWRRHYYHLSHRLHLLRSSTATVGNDDDDDTSRTHAALRRLIKQWQRSAVCTTASSSSSSSPFNVEYVIDTVYRAEDDGAAVPASSKQRENERKIVQKAAKAARYARAEALRAAANGASKMAAAAAAPAPAVVATQLSSTAATHQDEQQEQRQQQRQEDVQLTGVSSGDDDGVYGVDDHHAGERSVGDDGDEEDDDDELE